MTQVADQEQPQTEEKKEYQFKKQENGKFKAFKAGTDELLEGFEDHEFGSPLEGGRFIHALKKEIEKKAAEVAGKFTATNQTSTVSAGNTQTGFKVPLIGEEPDIHIIGGTKYFEVTVQEQANDVKRKDILATDGVSREFTILFGHKCILPIGVLNNLNESIYTFYKSHYDQAAGKAWIEPIDMPRFTIQIHREVPQSEADEWLKEQRKRYFSVY